MCDVSCWVRAGVLARVTVEREAEDEPRKAPLVTMLVGLMLVSPRKQHT